ncbi:TetR/AcrR family transcriptional regulator, partial [Mycolicibacterium vaccae]|nr:TetR/AcrR family transcriptional regulator [Mycolicibacterium vaccae]
LTTEPVMRQFLQLDADLSTVAGMCQQAKAFLDSASAAMAKALRAAGAAMPDAELSAVSELHIRLACSLASGASGRLDTRDDAAVREYARKHLAPLVW